MSTIATTNEGSGGDGARRMRVLQVRSVVGLAYDEIRTMIVEGPLEPGARLGQGELADRLGISRGSVREALRRLTGDGFVEFEVNRGFFVADLGLDAVLERLEARLLFEPAVARLATARRTEDDLEAMRAAVEAEKRAGTPAEVHDASRAFHRAVAMAGHNEAFVRIFDSLWIADVGRRLLARRSTSAGWQHDDVAEHRELLAAVERGQGRRAEELMREHVASAVRHWSH
jgi:DNA-binding GntR family transcriptional regulator